MSGPRRFGLCLEVNIWPRISLEVTTAKPMCRRQTFDFKAGQCPKITPSHWEISNLIQHTLPRAHSSLPSKRHLDRFSQFSRINLFVRPIENYWVTAAVYEAKINNSISESARLLQLTALLPSGRHHIFRVNNPPPACDAVACHKILWQFLSQLLAFFTFTQWLKTLRWDIRYDITLIEHLLADNVRPCRPVTTRHFAPCHVSGFTYSTNRHSIILVCRFSQRLPLLKTDILH